MELNYIKTRGGGTNLNLGGGRQQKRALRSSKRPLFYAIYQRVPEACMKIWRGGGTCPPPVPPPLIKTVSMGGGAGTQNHCQHEVEPPLGMSGGGPPTPFEIFGSARFFLKGIRGVGATLHLLATGRCNLGCTLRGRAPNFFTLIQLYLGDSDIIEREGECTPSPIELCAPVALMGIWPGTKK